MHKQTTVLCTSFNKFGTQIALPKAYISKQLKGKYDGQQNFLLTPTGKTFDAVVLKLLSGTNLILKVGHFDGFVNQSNIANFVITKASS